MDFSQAEEKFRELQARVQRGEPLTEEQYQEEMQRLMVQDDHGVFWSLEPGTGRWLYFNGTEWVPGTPPRSAPPSAPTATVPIETQAAGGMDLGPSTSAEGPVETAAVEPEAVPTYERAGEAGDRAGGITPRPVSRVPFPIDQGSNTWLPFAIGAVVLLLCAVVLFFGVRNMPLFGGATVKATATATVEAAAQPTEPEEQPTDTPEEPTPTTVASTATPNVVSVTMKEKLRVRSGPSTTGNVLASLDPGTAVTAIGRNADSSWIQIQLPGKTDTGWVINNPDYLTVSGDLNSLPVVGSGAAAKTTAPKTTPTKATAPKKSATPKPTPTETPAG